MDEKDGDELLCHRRPNFVLFYPRVLSPYKLSEVLDDIYSCHQLVLKHRGSQRRSLAPLLHRQITSPLQGGVDITPHINAL
jgi:hypothetical protein